MITSPLTPAASLSSIATYLKSITHERISEPTQTFLDKCASTYADLVLARWHCVAVGRVANISGENTAAIFRAADEGILFYRSDGKPVSVHGANIQEQDPPQQRTTARTDLQAYSRQFSSPFKKRKNVTPLNRMVTVYTTRLTTTKILLPTQSASAILWLSKEAAIVFLHSTDGLRFYTRGGVFTARYELNIQFWLITFFKGLMPIQLH